MRVRYSATEHPNLYLAVVQQHLSKVFGNRYQVVVGPRYGSPSVRFQNKRLESQLREKGKKFDGLMKHFCHIKLFDWHGQCYNVVCNLNVVLCVGVCALGSQRRYVNMHPNHLCDCSGFKIWAKTAKIHAETFAWEVIRWNMLPKLWKAIQWTTWSDNVIGWVLLFFAKTKLSWRKFLPHFEDKQWTARCWPWVWFYADEWNGFRNQQPWFDIPQNHVNRYSEQCKRLCNWFGASGNGCLGFSKYYIHIYIWWNWLVL